MNRTNFLRIAIPFILGTTFSFGPIKQLSATLPNPYSYIQRHPFYIKSVPIHLWGKISLPYKKKSPLWPFFLSSLDCEQVSTDIPLDKKQSVVNYTADIIIYDGIKRKLYLNGHGSVQNGNIKLTSGQILFDLNQTTLYAQSLGKRNEEIQDSPEIIHKEEQADKYGKTKQGIERTFFTDQLAYNTTTGRGIVHKLATKQDDMIIRADKVLQDDAETFQSTTCTFTTCPREHPHFYFKSNRVKFVKDQYIVSGPFTLYIADTATFFRFYSSALFLEHVRTHGLIPPRIGERGDGFYLEGLGYYIAFKDYASYTVRGSITTRGKLDIYNTLKYKKRYGYSGSLSHTYHADIKSKQDFWDLQWKHNTAPNHTNSRFSSEVAFSRTEPTTLGHSNRNQHNIKSKGTIRYSKTFSAVPYCMNLSLPFSKNPSDGYAEIEPNGTLEKTYSLYQQSGSSKHLIQLKNIELGHRIDLDTKFRKYSNNENLLRHNWKKDSSCIVSQTLPLSVSIDISHFRFNPSITYKDSLKFNPDVQFNHDRNRTPELYRNYGFDIANRVETALYYTKYFKLATIKGLRIKMLPSAEVRYRPKDHRQYFYPKHNLFSRPKLVSGDMQNNTNAYIDYLLDNSIQLKLSDKNAPDNNDQEEHYKKIYILRCLQFSTRYYIMKKQYDSMNISMDTDRYQLTKYLQFDCDARLRLGPDPAKSIDSYRRHNTEEITRLPRYYGKPFETLTFMDYGLNINLNPNPYDATDIVDLSENNDDKLFGYQTNIKAINQQTSWNIGLSLRHNMVRNPIPIPKYNHQASISCHGNAVILKHWEISCHTSYDFKTKKFDPYYTSISIKRDLHCWMLNYTWRPLGDRPSYDITLQAKSNLLKPYSLDRKRSYKAFTNS